MHNHVKTLLVCPACKQKLVFRKKTADCSSCKKKYILYRDVPIMIENSNGVFSGLEQNIIPTEKKELFKKLYKYITFSHTFKTKKSKTRIKKLLDDSPPENITINIGSGKTRYSDKIVNIDIELNNNIDIVADSCNLPFEDNSVDMIISQAVLEHIPNTALNISEMERVLKKGGKIYCEVPFMQTHHAHPHDYFRFTHSGLEDIFDKFTVLDKGIAVGPSSALSLVLRIYLSILFSFGNKKLFPIVSIIANWITVPIKFLDYFLEKNPLAYYSASGLYILVRKKH